MYMYFVYALCVHIIMYVCTCTLPAKTCFAVIINTCYMIKCTLSELNLHTNYAHTNTNPYYLIEIMQ